MTRKSGFRSWPVQLLMMALFILSLLAPQEWAQVTLRPIAKLIGSKETGRMMGSRQATAPYQGEKPRPADADSSPPPEPVTPVPHETEPTSPPALAADGSPWGTAPAETPATEPAPPTETVDSSWLIVNQTPPPSVWGPASGPEPTSVAAAGVPSVSSPLQDPNLAPPVEQPWLTPASDPSEGPSAVADLLGPLAQYAQPQRVLEIVPPVTSLFSPTCPAPCASVRHPLDEPSATAAIGREPTRLPVVAEVPQSSVDVRNLDRQALTSNADVVTHWPHPTEIVRRVEALPAVAPYDEFATKLLGQLRQLHELETLDSAEVAARLEDLRALAQTATEYSTAATDLTVRVELQRIGYGLSRRLAMWEQVHAIASQEPESSAAGVHNVACLKAVLAAVEQKLQTSANGRQWREYLLLDEARRCLASPPSVDTAEQRAVARRILLRLDYASLTPPEESFLKQPAFAALAAELKHLAMEPVNYFVLLQNLERYEGELEPQAAAQASTAQQLLRWSQSQTVQELGQRLDAYYRNANVRVSISKQLIQRLAPPPERTSVGVDDVILGARTVGCSETLTRLQVKLVPSPSRWRFELEARGEVSSATASRKGPATFYQSGAAVFRATKEVVVDPHGVRHTPAVTAASSASDLTGLETTLDSVPIIGDIAYNVARRQYRSHSDQARAEMDNKISWEASQRFDDTVDQRLQEVRQQFLVQFYQPMRKLALNPAVLDLQTTQDRLVMRYRLAGFHQLAAHTPRPQAPANSVLSVQLHESALNNLLDQFRWAGREANFRELHQEVAQLFHRTDWQLPEDLPDDVTVQFADEHPLRVTFQEGRVALTLAFAELSQGRSRWRDFTVRVRYLPAPAGTDADLVRDEYVELVGKRLHFRDQVALRSIFSRVFPRSRPIDLLSHQLRTDRRLQGLAVTQMTIDDGWIGVAVGTAPQVARRAGELKR
jgi:hypothetical protein